MAHDIQVVIDSQDPHNLADWWADALGWQVERQDEAFIRRQIVQGHATEADTGFHKGALVWKEGTAIRHPGGLERAPRVLFQLVPERKRVKNRIHLDVRAGAGSIDAEVERLVGKGAKVLHEGRQGPTRWVTIIDPEGNELCIA
ncbi:VOC family protein [Nonomuraea sp. C10]|uniref:VOC family protein n=1 Tax=Nonomuraea sp. C10 TaxID=2600577 RepID=UPI0011CE64D7|nr:VOC family protein [Nonomuraea sp. C10]TXK34817.1 VOC family protein [Nonomuraea sp. C10]